MNAAIGGLFGAAILGTGGLLAYGLYKHKFGAAAGKVVPPAGSSLDPGMDTYTASVVSRALSVETDTTILDKLAADLAGAGFKNSSAAVSGRSTTLKSQISGGVTQKATNVVKGLFSTAGQTISGCADGVVNVATGALMTFTGQSSGEHKPPCGPGEFFDALREVCVPIIPPITGAFAEPCCDDCQHGMPCGSTSGYFTGQSAGEHKPPCGPGEFYDTLREVCVPIIPQY